nr:MAG: ORF1 [TTV-like mini virus]
MARYYYRRRWAPRWRKRYRWFRPWRTRAPLRRTRRRRRRRVRRKLPFLPLKQWQPKFIHKLTVKGLFCLLQVHKVDYNQNFNQYANTITAEGLSNGGGFTLVRFNLNSLFEQHEKARNYWTKSNNNMPLFRYTGCMIKVYRPENIDLVIKFQRCYPMCCTKLMFTGCQPSLLMMSRGSKKIRCKKNNPNGKPYKKFYFKPPEQMYNKWYFQHNESQTGLIMIQAAAASFDQYYTSQWAESSSITLWGINTRIFQNLNFQTKNTQGYNPKTNFYLYAANGNGKLKDIIYLGQSQLYNEGTPIKDISNYDGSNWSKTLTNYFAKPKNWGNPFHQEHAHKIYGNYYFSQSPPLQTLLGPTGTQTHTGETEIKTVTALKEFTQEIFVKFRYNPFNDKGYNNIYIRANFEDNEDDLEPPDDIDLQNPGFPNWLACFGFRDYLIKLGKKPRITQDWVVLIKTKAFYPQETFYMLIDEYFLHGDSDKYKGRTDWDNEHWYPNFTHQQGALNTLALVGPGAPKLGDIKLAEAKIEYNFYFKVGGCAPPVEKVKDPANQPTYVTPTNIIDTNSLQSPEEPIETFLYQFDWRRHQITETAAQRILKDYPTKKHLFTDAGSSATEVPFIQTYKEELQTSEEEETEKETLFEQLQRQRLKQKDLRLRIKHLLAQLQNLE